MNPPSELLQRARAVLPGGVCSSTRFNTALGGPVYVARSAGAHFTDVGGRDYIDMCCGHGAALLDAARRGKRATVDYAKEHPWQVAGIAIGVAALVAWLAKRDD